MNYTLLLLRSQMKTIKTWSSIWMFFCNLQMMTLVCYFHSKYWIDTNFSFVVSYIMVSEERSKALIKGVSFGVVQKGDSVTRTLYLIGGASGEKMLDMSIQSRASPTHPEPDQIISTNETLRQLKIPVVPPMQYACRTIYLQDPRPLPPLVDLSKFEPDAFEPAGRALVSVDITCSGPLDIMVHSIQFVPQASFDVFPVHSY